MSVLRESTRVEPRWERSNEVRRPVQANEAVANGVLVTGAAEDDLRELLLLHRDDHVHFAPRVVVTELWMLTAEHEPIDLGLHGELETHGLRVVRQPIR